MRSFRILAVLGLVLSGPACDSGDDSGGDDDGAGGNGAAGSGGISGATAAGAAGTSSGSAGGPAGSSGAGGSAGTLGGSGASGAAGAGGSAGSAGSANGGGGAAGAGGGAGTLGGSGASGTAGAGGSAGSAGSANGGSGAADPCSSALFCDDFESYATGQAPGGKWSARTNSATVAVDEAQHLSGTKAVKFATIGSGSSKTAYMRVQDASIFPIANNTLYGRMMFYLESAPTTSVHWTFIEGGGLIEGQTYRALYRYGGQQPVGGGNQLMANYETPDSYNGTGPGSDCWHHSNGKTVPVGAWACVEWKFDGPNNEMRFWLDGVAVDDLTVTGTGQGCVNQPNDYPWTAPSFKTLDLGWESYQSDSERTLYIDDVVISTTQVGCPQ